MIKEDIATLSSEEIRSDFARAFNLVEHGYELSGILEYGFSDEDICNLAMLYKNDIRNNYRNKILELLEDCNFHTEYSDFVEGIYDKYIKEYNEPEQEL